MIEPCERPIMFELTQTAELSHWQGETTDRVWLGFLADVARFVGRERTPAPATALVSATAAAQATPTARGGRPSIAILPFTNRSTERADEVFAGGMGEDIASALSLGRGLKVISQSATAAYRKNTSDLRTIGQELGAKYVLEGNVRRVGASLRVTAQLVEADNGAILWTQKFDRPLSELAELQEELVEELAAHLGVQIQKVEMERALKKPGDITAWEAMMRSWAAYARMSAEGLAAGVVEARRAVSLAPDYAVARGTLAMALAITFNDTGYQDRRLIEEAVEHAEAALRLNPNHAMVLFQVANTFHNAHRWAEAMTLAQRAVEINPNMVDARQALACSLNHDERYDEALAQLAEAERVAPRASQQLFTYCHRCWALIGQGKLEAALENAHQAARLDPTGKAIMITKAVILQALGRADEAQAAIRNARTAAPGRSLEAWLHFARNTYMSARMFESYSRHFADAWNATPEDGAA